MTTLVAAQPGYWLHTEPDITNATGLRFPVVAWTVYENGRVEPVALGLTDTAMVLIERPDGSYVQHGGPQANDQVWSWPQPWAESVSPPRPTASA